MAKPLPRWIENTLIFVSPLAGSFFLAARNEKDRYNDTKMIMIGDIKADWLRIGKTGNPFNTTDVSVNKFMEEALPGRAAYWMDRFKNAKKDGEKRVAARHLAVIDELTRNFVPVEPYMPKKDIKQTADLDITGGTTGGTTGGATGGSSSGFVLAPDGSVQTAPQVPGIPGTKPWYMNMKIMVPVYIGAVALFYLLSKKR